jgi:hypothetical protein
MFMMFELAASNENQKSRPPEGSIAGTISQDETGSTTLIVEGCEPKFNKAGTQIATVDNRGGDLR